MFGKRRGASWSGRTAKRTTYNGRTYRSGLEAETARALTEAGLEFRYESVRRPYVEHRIYLEDFSLEGGPVIEAKGVLSPDERRKLIAIRASHPDLNMILVFANPERKISKAARALTYRQWAVKHGMQACAPAGLAALLESYR